MAGIPLPDRGQPIDITYLYDIVNTINDISNQISDATTDYTTIYTRDSGPQRIQTKGARIIGAYVDIISNDTVTAGSSKSFSFEYTSDFLYPPIAIATVVNRGLSDIGDDVIAVIRTVTTSRVDGIVKFNKNGTVSTSVNLILIGIPTPS
jgi:hypothetical protein